MVANAASASFSGVEIPKRQNVQPQQQPPPLGQGNGVGFGGVLEGRMGAGAAPPSMKPPGFLFEIESQVRSTTQRCVSQHLRSIQDAFMRKVRGSGRSMSDTIGVGYVRTVVNVRRWLRLHRAACVPDYLDFTVECSARAEAICDNFFCYWRPAANTHR